MVQSHLAGPDLAGRVPSRLDQDGHGLDASLVSHLATAHRLHDRRQNRRVIGHRLVAKLAGVMMG